MVCLDEKVNAGLAGSAVAAGGVGMITSTATGPGFFAVAAGWVVACATYGVTLGRLAQCLAQAGYPEMAANISARADAIMREIEEFKAWARSVGADL
jgi:hypothetical protein